MKCCLVICLPIATIHGQNYTRVGELVHYYVL
jgi:hypothetical protein